MKRDEMERRLRFDHENLKRLGARQSAAYREAVKREIGALERERIIGG